MKKEKVPCVDCISLPICLSKLISYEFETRYSLIELVDIILDCSMLDEYTGHWSDLVDYETYEDTKENVIEYFLSKSQYLRDLDNDPDPSH